LARANDPHRHLRAPLQAPAEEAKAVAIAGPAIVRKRAAGAVEPDDYTNHRSTAPTGVPANDDRKPAEIVTARRPTARRVDVPDLTPETPEEYQRRGEAADALWRELVRRATAKDRREQGRRCD
jgi:hypothetical protein